MSKIDGQEEVYEMVPKLKYEFALVLFRVSVGVRITVSVGVRIRVRVSAGVSIMVSVG